jgi:hypothetical protein
MEDVIHDIQVIEEDVKDVERHGREVHCHAFLGSVGWRAGADHHDAHARANDRYAARFVLCDRRRGLFCSLQFLWGECLELQFRRRSRIDCVSVAADRQLQRAPAHRGGDLDAGGAGQRPPDSHGGCMYVYVLHVCNVIHTDTYTYMYIHANTYTYIHIHYDTYTYIHLTIRV